MTSKQFIAHPAHRATAFLIVIEPNRCIRQRQQIGRVEVPCPPAMFLVKRAHWQGENAAFACRYRHLTGIVKPALADIRMQLFAASAAVQARKLRL